MFHGSARGGAPRLRLALLHIHESIVRWIHEPSTDSAYESKLGTQDLDLVGGLEHEWIMTFHTLGMSSSQLTNIFFRGVQTTNQRWLIMSTLD